MASAPTANCRGGRFLSLPLRWCLPLPTERTVVYQNTRTLILPLSGTQKTGEDAPLRSRLTSLEGHNLACVSQRSQASCNRYRGGCDLLRFAGDLPGHRGSGGNIWAHCRSLDDQLQRLTAQPRGKLRFALVRGVVVSRGSANAGMKALFDALNVVYGEE